MTRTPTPAPVPALGARLGAYIDEVRSWCRGGPVTEARLATLRAAAARLVSAPLELAPGQRVVPTTGYGRNLLHHDAEHGFVVLAMVWPAGIGGNPHDHGTWGVVAVAEGEVEVVDYAAQPLDSQGERVALTPLARVVGGPGATAFVLPPDHDLHSVANASATRPALSIHTYGRHIDRCRVMDRETGAVTWVTPQYHSVP